MQRAWLFERFAVTLAGIDFIDPELAHEPDARERGVRVEIRPLTSTLHGSGYASPEVTLAPAVRRIDLLESRLGAADRMHWHPTMADGEPGDREFDPALTADPVGWLRAWLTGPGAELSSAAADEVADAVARTLTAVRDAPWTDVDHDENGLAELS